MKIVCECGRITELDTTRLTPGDLYGPPAGRDPDEWTFRTTARPPYEVGDIVRKDPDSRTAWRVTAVNDVSFRAVEIDYPPAGRSAELAELLSLGMNPATEGYMAHMGYDRPPLEGDWDEDFRKPGFTGDLSDAQMGELHDLPECDYVVVDGMIHELDAWLEYNGYKAPPRNHGKEAE